MVTTVETYFKNKINWKFLDFLQQVLLSVEDQGFDTYLSIVTFNGKYRAYKLIYEYAYVEGETINIYKDFIVSDEDKTAILHYCLTITQDIEDDFKDLEPLYKTIKQKLEPKCDFHEVNYYPYKSLIVTSNNSGR